MNKATKRIVSLLLVTVLTLSMAACGDKPTPEPSSDTIIESNSSLPSTSSSSEPSTSSSTTDSSSSSSSSNTSTGVSKDTRTQAEIQKDILGKMTAAYQKNEDVVGYIYFPSTTISEPVVHDPTGTGSDDDYYMRRNWQREDDYNGCYFADPRATFGGRNELSKNTVVYGHSMSDDPQSAKGKIMFGQLNLLRDLNFAKDNQFVYFSTPKAGMVWQVFAVFVTTRQYKAYIENNPSAANLQNVINHARERSLYNYDVPVGTNDKILTMSTCTYAVDGKALKYPNDYRYVVMAKLVEDKAALTPAKVEKNPSPKAP